MNWPYEFNNALNYIERNLRLDINLEEIAKQANCSKYNFERLFSFITGFSLAYYIKKRIMDEATKDLVLRKLSVTEVALNYGYETPSSFSRAFKQINGISPKEAIKIGSTLTSFSPLSFEMKLKGLNEMKFRLEKEDKFVLHGLSQTFTNVNGENFLEIPNMWANVSTNGDFDKLAKTCDSKSKFKAVFGVCYAFSLDCTSFKYMIGVPGNSKEYEEILIEPQLYAKFSCKGVKNLQETVKNIFSEWLPNSEYRHADSPELEFYPQNKNENEERPCEVWIPVVKK